MNKRSIFQNALDIEGISAFSTPFLHIQITIFLIVLVPFPPPN